MRNVIALAILALVATSGLAGYAEDGKHHWLFNNHPRLRRITKAAGFGVVTGGLAAPFLGGAAATGAMIGATEHATARGIKDKHDLKHHKHLDSHIW